MLKSTTNNPSTKDPYIKINKKCFLEENGF
jgi:hypothetical protein